MKNYSEFRDPQFVFEIPEDVVVQRSEVQAFCEGAEVHGKNGEVWMVDGDRMLATHTYDRHFVNEDWDSVHAPTFRVFLEFLEEFDFTPMDREFLKKRVADFLQASNPDSDHA